MDMALDLKVPIVAIVDSGGARIQEGVAALTQYGHIFRKTCDASGFVPQISLILGPCAGGAVYCPALTDLIVMTKENSDMFVTGPDVVKAATGETISMNDLGGGLVHSTKSGVAHYLGEDEADAIDYARTVLAYLPSNSDAQPPMYAYAATRADRETAKRLTDIVPDNDRQPYDVLDVIRCIVDYGEFVQVHELFATSAVVGFACIDGLADRRGRQPAERSRRHPRRGRLRRRWRGSCVCATRSTCRSSRSWTPPDTSRAPIRSTPASSAAAPR